MSLRRLVLPSALALCAACGEERAKAPPPPPPPPLATTRVDTEVAPAAPTEPAPQPQAAEQEKRAPSDAPKHAPKPGRSAKVTREARAPKQTRPSPAPARPSAPAPAAAAAPAPARAERPAGKVAVPSTAHVRIDVPSALQADLDRDPRMQPWVNQVISVIDRCYGQSGAGLGGTIEVVVTMHANERPDADIKSLPPALSPIVACATGGLMRTKMPLFTGTEGARSLVRIQFK